MTTQEYHSPLYQDYRRRMIDAVKLAGHFDGLYYAEINDMIDFDIEPSRYPAVTIRRIKADYYYRKFPYCLKG
jgi:hypothetical protein